MARVLAAAAIAWPLWLGADVWQRAHGPPGLSSVILHAVASRICHQRPERSFHAGTAKWPVCARCTALYVAAPFGAVAALVSRRRVRRALWPLGVAAAPTALTLAIEWAGLADPGNVVRAAAALPLGAMTAWLVVHAAQSRDRDRVD